VPDPDGNLADISAGIEVRTLERPEGLWPHEQRTLNLRGMAIMHT
jgi:catechol 2,3-dioxygenase